jgi:hypothetical protein
MRVLIAVGNSPDGCADSLAVVASFPWTAETAFSVLTVAEIVTPPTMFPLPPT